MRINLGLEPEYLIHPLAIWVELRRINTTISSLHQDSQKLSATRTLDLEAVYKEYWLYDYEPRLEVEGLIKVQPINTDLVRIPVGLRVCQKTCPSNYAPPPHPVVRKKPGVRAFQVIFCCTRMSKGRW